MSFIAGTYHPGEQHLHSILKIPADRDNPTAPGHALPYFATTLSRFPLYAIGTLDDQNRPWTTLWGGAPGLSQALGKDILGIKAAVDAKYDPVVQALFNGVVEDGKVVKGDAGERRMVSGLAIDLQARKRVKLFGRAVVCAIGAEKEEEVVDEGCESIRDVGAEKKMVLQLVLQMEQLLGNCPKYINKKSLRPVRSMPKIVSEGSELSPEALKVISEADTFFISSSNANEDMDTNHRGGSPGFVRIRYYRATSSHELIYPEYSGNRLYQTLGNLYTTPYAGLVFPDFGTGDVLYITGTTSIHVGKDAAALLPHSNLVVKVKIIDHRFVQRGLPFIATDGSVADMGRSPYNPRVRLLSDERPTTDLHNASETRQTATLLSQTLLTPTISRFSFSLTSPSTSPSTIWKPGQYVMLDFSSEMDEGYSHMRDDDPRSINDDFVRSFTVSSIPLPSSTSKGNGALPPSDSKSSGKEESRGSTFELTLRKISGGPVTQYLFRQGKDKRAASALPVEIPVMGFAGDFGFDVERARKTSKNANLVYVCSGVGVTPLLAQMEVLAADEDSLLSRLVVFWTVHADDVAFVIDTLARTSQLKQAKIALFMTGVATDAAHSDCDKMLGKLTERGVTVMKRRFREDDFKALQRRNERIAQEGIQDEKDQVYVCANPKLTALLRKWMQKLDFEIVSEDFAY